MAGGSRYGVEIRAANAGDAADIAALLSAASSPPTAREVAERLEAAAAGGAVLVAENWGPLAGVVALRWVTTLQQARPTAVITALSVGEDDRRRGIGRLLLKAGAQAARSAGCDLLEIAAASPDLRGFCESNGFTPAGERFTRALRKRRGGEDDG
ncbi:GNAT family N-acetyltransferase [Roseomonas elaeocarpi]|uniref:GNAT family N-acetyltransferase n=1 Tax=Roseomonas elaeocarpi TaxID=907779 RepID=A0ABV6JQN7_9PROT